MYLKVKGFSYMGLSTTNNITLYEDTTISGNLDAGKVLTLKIVPGVSDTSPLTIINESLGGGTGVVYQSTASGQGFNIAYMTAQSSVAWVEGVNWVVQTSLRIIKSGSNGLTLEPTGDAVLSGHLDVSVSNPRTPIKAYSTMDGYTSYIELEAKWNSQGYLNFESNRSGANCLFLTVKDDLHMHCGSNLAHFYKPTSNASDDRLKENEDIIENACETLSN